MMATEKDPPPLFENVDINKLDEEEEDLFKSALEESPNVFSGGLHFVEHPLNNSKEDTKNDLFEDSQSTTTTSPPPTISTTTTTHTQININNNNYNNNNHNDQEPIEERLDTNGSSKLQSLEEVIPREISDPPSLPKSSSQQKSFEDIEKESGDQLLEVSISEPQKVGEGMSVYVAYKVTTRTNMPLYKKRHFSVLRRFSDFLGLHDKLVEKYLKTGRIIPPAPEKSVLGTTKIKMSNQPEGQGSSADFLEKRRASLERYINRTAQHPILSVDPDFREFLEADMELPRATSTSALSGAGVLRLFNKVGETVNKMTYKMDEGDPWFEEKTQQVENLDQQLRKLHSSVENLVLHRKDLALLTSSFAKSAAMLSNCEEHTSLSRALSQLAEVEEKVEALHNEQANADFSILCELLKDYVALIGAIKDVFHERVKVYQNWQHSQQMLNKKRELKAKFELSGKSDKGNQVNQEVIEWEAKVERGQEEFDNISKMIKKEMERFEVNRVKDFKQIIIQYLENIMNNQQQLIKYWETFLPEAKAIA